MKKSFFQKVKFELAGLSFLRRNLKTSRALTPMQSSQYQNYQMAGLKKDQLSELDKLHQSVRNGRGLNFWRKLYLKYQGEKVCAVVFDENNNLAGFNYYYFREDEIPNCVIHDAFLGISSKHRSKGIATALQTYAVEQLSQQPLTGISGNVSKANKPSVKMLRRVGFTLSDDPDDETNFNIFFDFKKPPLNKNHQKG